MTYLSPSNSQNISALSEFDLTNDFHEKLNPGVYEYQELEDCYYPKSRGYQKPKQRWMAKDQSMTISSLNNNYSATTCPESSEERLRIAEIQQLSQTTSNFTPNRNGYTGFSPSTSSSAPGTVAMPSSLTNTSSSPSNHTLSNSRNELNTIDDGSRCTSPNCESNVPCNRLSVTEDDYIYKAIANPLPDIQNNVPQMKRRRGRPPKSQQLLTRIPKLQKRKKRQPKIAKIPQPNPSFTQLSQEEPIFINKTDNLQKIEKNGLPNFQLYDIPEVPINSVVGGLKIRLRRDNTVNEPVCGGKKARMRKAPKAAGVFRIVESWCDTDAPGGDLSHRVFAAKSSATSPSSSVNLSASSFRVGDVVWAKLAGYPYWPSRISALWARTAHQLAQVSPSQNIDNSSLSVMATPADSSLAPGFTARVEWFAWDQCSYLSCTKLFPFLESFDRLYNPRTRVKGYTDAVKMAKAIVSNYEAEDSNGYVSEHFPSGLEYLNEAPPTSVPPNFDNSCSVSVPHSIKNNLDVPVHTNACPLDLSLQFSLPDASFSSETQELTYHHHHPYSSNTLNLTSNANEFYQDSCLPDLGTQSWAPLPQLDISGFGDIISHVPTFSEDEDDPNDSVANQLKIQLSPIT